MRRSHQPRWPRQSCAPPCRDRHCHSGERQGLRRVADDGRAGRGEPPAEGAAAPQGRRTGTARQHHRAADADREQPAADHQSPYI